MGGRTTRQIQRERTQERLPARTCDLQLNQRMCQARNALNLLSRQRPTAYCVAETDKINPGRESGEGNTRKMEVALRLPHAKALRYVVGGMTHTGRARSRMKRAKGDMSATLDRGVEYAAMLPLSHQAKRGIEE